ncbi:MAG: DUF4258 domain-containing protein, partial [Defluviitaleaceae bacterium]|nr:DUF4258 domain-containing protein [Defluviitaleaceae bacterium]
RERGIRRMDLLECIYNGEIIKQYTDDTPFPSCLILGYYAYNQPLHIVVGVNAGVLCSIITAYRPDINQWESDYKTRKGQ